MSHLGFAEGASLLRVLADTFMGATFRPRDERFEGTLRHFARDGVRVFRLNTTGHTLERTSRILNAQESRCYVLCVQLSGAPLLMDQGGREAILHQGDTAMFDLARAHLLVREGEATTLGVVVPVEALRFPTKKLATLLSVKMDAADPVTAAARDTLTSFESRLAEMPPVAQGRIARSVVDLFETLCLHHGMRLRAWGGAGRIDQFEAILHFIDGHLEDPELSPSLIAATHHISVRTLHSLALDSGISIAAFVRRQRLERCRADLENPTLSDLSIAEIGARWGIVRPSHFSGLFRREYGRTPSEYRRRMGRHRSQAELEPGRRRLPDARNQA